MAGNPNHDKDGKFSSGHNAGGGNRAVAAHIKRQHDFVDSLMSKPTEASMMAEKLAASEEKNPTKFMAGKKSRSSRHGTFHQSIHPRTGESITMFIPKK